MLALPSSAASCLLNRCSTVPCTLHTGIDRKCPHASGQFSVDAVQLAIAMMLPHRLAFLGLSKACLLSELPVSQPILGKPDGCSCDGTHIMEKKKMINSSALFGFHSLLFARPQRYNSTIKSNKDDDRRK